MDADAFPALDRAKLRFLQRQARRLAALDERGVARIERRSRDRRAYRQPLNEDDIQHCQQPIPMSIHPSAVPRSVQNASTIALDHTSAIVESFCTDLDRELLSITSEVESIRDSVRKEHQRVLADVNETLSFLAHNPDAKTFPLKSSTKLGVPVIRIHRRQRQTIKLMVARKPIKVVETVQPFIRDAASSALEIQMRFRRYLYTWLYRGGRGQFAQVCQHRRRHFLTKAWKAWIQIKDRAKHARAQRIVQTLSRMDHKCEQWRRTRAQCVKMTDGKYGMAKQYAEVVTYARVFRAWLSLVVSPDELPQQSVKIKL